jgi:hypothetical protein
LILECNGHIGSVDFSYVSISGLTACIKNQLFALTINDSVVNIWKEFKNCGKPKKKNLKKLVETKKKFGIFFLKKSK